MTRVVLVTGGTGALGGAVVRTFLDGGDAVATTYRKEAEFRELEAAAGATDRLRGYQTDVTDAVRVAETVAAIARDLGDVDVLVHVAGGYAGGVPVAETSDATWGHMLALNLTTAFLCARAVLPRMIERRSGKIVAVSSRAAVRVFPGIGAYAASKAGLIALVETIAAETVEHDIQANVVLPSVIDTPANRAAMPDADPSVWVTPEELAAVIRFLASPEADRISGASVPVYGRA